MSTVVLKTPIVTTFNGGVDLEAPGYQQGNRVGTVIDYQQVGNNNTVGDIWLFDLVPTNAMISSIKIFNEALDTNGSPLLTLDIGFYNGPERFQDGVGGTVYAALSAVGSATLIASALTQNAASTTGTEIRFSAATLATSQQRVWEWLALSADPGKVFHIAVKIHAAAATAPTNPRVMVKVDYTNY